MIYGGTNGYVFAINPKTGEEEWRTKLSTGFFNAVARQDVMVILRDGIVIASSYGHIFGLDAKSGEVLWHNGLKGLGHDAISMAAEGVAIQYMHKDTQSSS